MPAPQLEREFARRALVANSLLGSLQRLVANGPLLQLISISQFALTDADYAVITSVFATASLAQLVGLVSQYRLGIYPTLIGSYRVRTVLLACMAAIPLALPGSSPGAAAGFFLCAYLVCTCHAAGFNVCWPAILRAGTDPAKRGRVTGRLRSTQVALAAAMVLVITLIGPRALAGVPFAVLLVLFAVYSFIATRQVEWMHSSLPVATPPASRSVFAGMREDARRLFALADYRRAVLLAVLLGLSVFPIQIYFLRDVIGLPTQALFWYSAALTWAGILSIQGWGRVIDKFGAWAGLRHAIAIVVIGFAILLGVMLAAPARGTAMPAVQQAVAVSALLCMSVATQGVGLLWFNCAMEIVPAEATTLGVLVLGLANELAVVGGAVAVTFLRGHLFRDLAAREALIVAMWATMALVCFTVVHRRNPALAAART